jgi:hypothetical protein
VNPAAPLATFPLGNPTTDAGRRAAELHATWANHHDRIAAVERAYLDAQEALKVSNAEMEQALYGAAATGRRGRAVAHAEAAYATAKTEAEAPWEQRLRAPIMAAEQARAEYESHISNNLDAILTEPELAEEAGAARDEVLATTQAQAAAFERWLRCRGAHEAIIGSAEGINGRSIPDLGAAATAARQAGESMLASQETARPAAGEPLPYPRVSQRALDDRRVRRGEAEVVEVDGPAGRGIQVRQIAG